MRRVAEAARSGARSEVGCGAGIVSWMSPRPRTDLRAVHQRMMCTVVVYDVRLDIVTGRRDRPNGVGTAPVSPLRPQSVRIAARNPIQNLRAALEVAPVFTSSRSVSNAVGTKELRDLSLRDARTRGSRGSLRRRWGLTDTSTWYRRVPSVGGARRCHRAHCDRAPRHLPDGPDSSGPLHRGTG